MNKKVFLGFLIGVSLLGIAATVSHDFPWLRVDTIQHLNNASGVYIESVQHLNNTIRAAAFYKNDDTELATVTEVAAKQDTITVSGILKGDGAGNISAASSGTDYAAPATTLAGYGITDAVLSSSVSVDTGLADDSDSLIPSQRAVKYYVDNNGGAVSSVFGKTGAVANISDSSGYLKNDGAGNFSYDNPSGSGDVTGPASSTDGNVVTFNGATGKIIKDSGLTLSGSNTGDEDTSSIKTKLGAAATGSDGYLTSTDWNTFNGKQAAFAILSTFGNLSSSSGYLKNDGAGNLSYDTPAGSGSTDDTSRGDGTWTSTTSSPSQRATEEALNDSGVRYDDRASASGVSDHERLLMRNVSSDSANTKLLLHFEGDDASTTFTDSSEALQEITAYGNAQIDTAQYKFGAASGLFDGTGDYLGLTDSTDFNLGISASPFTIEFWYKSSTSANMCFYNRGGGGSDWSMTNGWQQLIQYETSGEMVFYYNNNGSSVRVSQTASVDGNWHHVAVVYDGTTTYVYVDGTRGTGVTTGGYYKPTTSNVTRIGYYQNSSGGYFNGWLDEFRISKGVARWSANFSVETSAYSVSTERDNRMSSVKVSDINHAMCQGRLTLESGVPVSTTDQTAKTTLYFTPNVTGQNCGNKITVYDGTKWVLYSFTELSFITSSLTASTNYDIFIYNNSGTLTLSATAWTDGTTRATALYPQDGIYVKTGATNYRYLGTIRITGTTGQCEDSIAKRFVWNMYNRVATSDFSTDSTASWTTNGNGTWSAMNSGNAAWKHEFVLGVAGDSIIAKANVCGANLASSAANVAFGYDSTSSVSAYGGISFNNLSSGLAMTMDFTTQPAVGYHYLNALNTSSNTGNATFYGYQAPGAGSIGIKSTMTVKFWR